MAEVVESDDHFRIELDRLAELGRRLVELLLGGEDDAQAVVSVRGLRIEIDRSSKGGDRSDVVLLLKQLLPLLHELRRGCDIVGVLSRGERGESENGDGEQRRRDSEAARTYAGGAHRCLIDGCHREEADSGSKGS
jgi:hypothetical protein